MVPETEFGSCDSGDDGNHIGVGLVEIYQTLFDTGGFFSMGQHYLTIYISGKQLCSHYSNSISTI